jgi:hypothetical protein
MTATSPESGDKTEAMKVITDLIAGDKGRDIFRGQPQSGLALLPKAQRGEFNNGDHLEALKRFRRECWAFGLKATDSLQDLAIAQHYGLATSLLDWTTNPLVALFFACGEARDIDGKALDGEVFVLNNPVPLDKVYFEGDKWENIEGLKLYNPPLIDSRIARQKGLFTIQGKDIRPINDLVSRHELVPHLILAELKRSLLEILYTMGIDRSTLFPDPDGLCDRINWETKNRIERHFPPVSGARVVYLQVHAVIGVSGSVNPTLIKADPPPDQPQTPV